MLTKRQQQGGFSLVEILISMAISLILLTSVLLICAEQIKSSYHGFRLGTLELQLRAVVNNIAHDIRRAGFWGDEQGILNNNLSSGNPYMQTTTKLNIKSLGSSDCISLAYDLNNNGNASFENERFSYRLVNGVLQGRVASDNLGCDASSGWVGITDAQLINISRLNFQEIPAAHNATGAAFARNIQLELTANLVADPQITKTITKMVHVYNNWVQP